MRPPGDLRMALAALCDDDVGPHWRDVLQHRFAGDGPLGGHALGNLLIVSRGTCSATPSTGSTSSAGCSTPGGRVLPMAAVPLEIEADVVDLDGDLDGDLEVLEGADPADAAGAAPAVRTLRGQHRVAGVGPGAGAARLLPADALPTETLEAVRDADWVVLGPGSWFTSVIPHVLVPSLREALAATSARRLLRPQPRAAHRRDEGLPREHLASLARHARSAPRRGPRRPQQPRRHGRPRGAARGHRALGAELVVSVSSTSHPGQHDSLRLAAAYRDIIG